MEEYKKTKIELLSEAQEFADKLEEKKEVIETALSDLDKKIKDNTDGKEILSGMAIIEELFAEYEEIEFEQLKVLEKIKGK